MVLKGINGFCVMKKTGFLLEGSEKFGLIHAIFWPEFMRPTDIKLSSHCFSIITNYLDTSHE
jgi:hypothetical protein